MTIEAPILNIAPRTAMLRLRARWEMASRHPLYFLRYFVRTLDQHAPDEMTVRPFPIHRPHLQALTQLWLDVPLIVCAKSRQVLATWLFVALNLWYARFRHGRLIMFQSKKEDDAKGNENAGDGLLGRGKFILNHIPYHKELCADVHIGALELEFTRMNSTIMAIPQGADIIRTHTASSILSDESGYQPDFSDSYTAAIPTITRGGKFTALSSANPGFFQQLFEDRIGGGR